MVMILVLGVTQNLQEFGIAADPADVFGRTCPAPVDAARILHPRLRIVDLFHRNAMLPTVAEIIAVKKPRALLQIEAAHTPAALVTHVVWIVRVGHAV